MSLALSLHLLAVVLWVGGMFFAYMALRPVASELLPPPLRLPLWSKVFARFFRWVTPAVVILFLSGIWMLMQRYGGIAAAPWHIHGMFAIGLVMIAIYAYVRGILFVGLNAAVDAENWPQGAALLGKIRPLIALNLSLGVLVIVMATAGRLL